jgi:predicted secreted protein
VVVDVLDHVPVSRTDRIRIEDVKYAPEPTVRDDQGREGVLRWERSLVPGGKDQIEVRFTVAHTKDVNLPDF